MATLGQRPVYLSIFSRGVLAHQTKEQPAASANPPTGTCTAMDSQGADVKRIGAMVDVALAIDDKATGG